MYFKIFSSPTLIQLDYFRSGTVLKYDFHNTAWKATYKNYILSLHLFWKIDYKLWWIKKNRVQYSSCHNIFSAFQFVILAFKIFLSNDLSSNILKCNNDGLMMASNNVNGCSFLKTIKYCHN